MAGGLKPLLLDETGQMMNNGLLRIADAIQKNGAVQMAGGRLSVYDEESGDSFSIQDENENAVLMVQDGHLKTKFFDSGLAVTKKTVAGYDVYAGEPIILAEHYCTARVAFPMTHSVSGSIQGGAAYGGYYFQLSDSLENCGVYRIETGELLQVYSFPEPNPLFHCNNANFGRAFYDAGDAFPLLYVSMENIGVHNVHVYRVSGEPGALEFTLVQTLTWDAPDQCGVYYPNGCIDPARGEILQIGYSRNSYLDGTDNGIVINTFKLPPVTDGDVNLQDAMKTDSFTVEFAQCTQGCFVHNRKLYQVYGGGISDSRSIRVVDLNRKAEVSRVDLTAGNLEAVTLGGEQETVFTHNGMLYCVGINKIVYQIDFRNWGGMDMKTSIIVKDADFSNNCVESQALKDVRKEIAAVVLKCGYSTGVRGTAQTGYQVFTSATRATVLVNAEDAISVTDGISYNLSGFAHVAIPKGAVSEITLNLTNPDYFGGLTLIPANATSANMAFDSGYIQGGTGAKTFRLNELLNKDGNALDLSDTLYLASSFKKGSAGSEAFTSETIESVGWSLAVR